MVVNFSKYIPQKTYNAFGYVFLSVYIIFGIVLIGFASNIESETTLQCGDQDENFAWLATHATTRSSIETHCLIEYKSEFYPYSLPLVFLLVINFGIVVVSSILYACSVKRRVESFVEHSHTPGNGGEDDGQAQPLLTVSKAARDPEAHRHSGCLTVFKTYVLHLIICRLAPLTGFPAMLIASTNFPEQYQCHWARKLTGISRHLSFAQRQTAVNSTIDCIYPMGDESRDVAIAFIVVSFVFDAIAFIEFVYLLWRACIDRSFSTDIEFCCVYLLRKRKSIRELITDIRRNISHHTFDLNDDFGGKRRSCRRLEDVYVDVIIQEGRESISRRFENSNRHRIYEAQFETSLNTITLAETADLFNSMPEPRTILVVGRPGIGKTLLTKNTFYQWKRQLSRFWRGKIVILIRFRLFNNNNWETSLREMLRRAEGFKMSSADFNSFYEYVCLVPRKVIFIFDGLDELDIDDECLTKGKTVDGHNEVTHVLMIFKQLVKGELLPGAKVLTTARPTAESIYNDLNFDREVEIVGFHRDQIKKYVETFCCNDMDQSRKIWNFIDGSPELLSLCYLPVNSYIVCLTLKESIGIDAREGADGTSSVPKTITELYKRAIKILLYRHHVKYRNQEIPKDYMIAKLPERLQNEMRKLKEIAMDGMISDKMTFEFETGDKFLDDLADCGLFNKLEDKRQNIFCFLHLTIQEFLAALHVVDDMENVEKFLSEYIDDPKWHLVIQFVSGLIGDKFSKVKEERKKSFSKR